MKRTRLSFGAVGVTAVLAVVAILRAGASPSVTATFADNGPAGIISDTPSHNPLAGAISSLALHPTNPDILWIGSVNGGVWKTTTATHAKPNWVPLTDHQASLSIGALALDPTFPQPTVLVAGIGNPSSFVHIGGPRTGILRTTDGGDHWTPLGAEDLADRDITGVAPRGSVIVVSTDSGIWRSDDTGASFHQLGKGKGLVRHQATALVGDPVKSDTLFTAILGAGGGVFLSENSGESWDRVSGETFHRPGGPDLVTDASSIVLSVHDDGKHEVVYAGVLDADKVQSGIFRSTDRGRHWTSLDNPTVENKHQHNFTILADPISPTIFYLGGGGEEGEGILVRCDASLPAKHQCTSIVGDHTLNGSSPHGDSRAMQFDVEGSLLETDDGGIFKRVIPRSSSGFWISLNGDLSITETHSCAWDHIRHVAFCGTQDNGTVAQPASGAAVWKQIGEHDGGNVTVSAVPGLSTKYFSDQRLLNFTRETCISAFCATSTPSLIIEGRAAPLDESTDPTLESIKPAYVPVMAHALNPQRLVIATGFVYESDNGGDTLTRLAGFEGSATRAIAFGSSDNHDLLYVGSSEGLFRHTTKFGRMRRVTAYPGGKPVDLALDPADQKSVWVMDATSVYHTANGGTEWHDETADLGPGGAGARELRAIALVPASSGSNVFVGASDGLYIGSTTQPGHWHKLRGRLPNAVVYDLHFDREDDILLIGTLGRGAWTIANPTAIQLRVPAAPR